MTAIIVGSGIVVVLVVGVAAMLRQDNRQRERTQRMLGHRSDG
jgi:hypothetical protein